MITVNKLKKTYRSPVKTGNPLRDIFNRSYKSKTALNEISFEIGDRELVGFIGPNGAGKTTTMKILAGILYPTGGTVKVNEFTPFDKKNDFLRQIAFVMGQKNQMLWELPATDTFRLNKEIYEVADVSYKRTLDELIKLLKVEKIIDRPVKTLSLGQRMRVELIATLIHSPKVLFLDEPTIGLDIFAQTTIVNFIKEYQKRFDSTIILTSHYMQDVERLAKRVIMIDEGKIVYDGKLQQLVDTYSQTKTVGIALAKEFNKDTLDIPEDITIEYQYPQLRLTMKKEQIEKYLPIILESVDYIDLTIENEPLEEVIKKTFTASQNIA